MAFCGTLTVNFKQDRDDVNFEHKIKDKYKIFVVVLKLPIWGNLKTIRIFAERMSLYR